MQDGAGPCFVPGNLFKQNTPPASFFWLRLIDDLAWSLRFEFPPDVSAVISEGVWIAYNIRLVSS